MQRWEALFLSIVGLFLAIGGTVGLAAPFSNPAEEVLGSAIFGMAALAGVAISSFFFRAIFLPQKRQG